MFILSAKKGQIKGQILLAILVSIAVFAILAHALFTLIAASFDLVSFNRARLTARHLAQEKIELIRNLNYADVGTVGGIPAGILEQEETVQRNGLSYTIKTSIIYIDDPFDELAPTDTTPDDYKRARIEVSWEGLAASNKNPVILITDISANAAATSGGGTLIILVFDANGNPISQADVTIVASTIDPPVNLAQQTDSEGKLILPGATSCVECYEITVTKEGFSTDRTYGTNEVANPFKNHASIFEDDLTQISFAIDVVGTINISSVNSRENNFAALESVPFRLRGNKLIGTDASAQPVYKYDQALTTDSSGNLNLSNMEWDAYTLLMPNVTSYDISGTSPLQPLSLAPAGNVDFTFSVEPHTDHSLFITVKDTSQNLIASASARIYDDFGYEQIEFTGESGNPDHGQTLFSSLEAKIYHLTASASGYLDFNGDFEISGYTKTDIVLTPQ